MELEDGSDWKLIYAYRDPNDSSQKYVAMSVALETLLAGEAFVGDLALSSDDGRSFITADMELSWAPQPAACSRAWGLCAAWPPPLRWL